MALTDSQYEALVEQLQKKKQKIGDAEYETFAERAIGKTKSNIAQEKPSTATFPASPTDTPLEAGAKSLGNVPSSAFNFGKNIFTAVTNPIETVKGLFNVLRGGGSQLRDATATGINKITGTEIGTNALGQGTTPQAEQTFEAVKNSLVERYGSFEAAQKTATEDPIGFGADVAGILAGTSLANKVSQINDLAKSSIAAKVSTKLDDVALGQMQKAINLNPTDIRRIQLPNYAGESPAAWLLKRDFKGSQESIVEQLNSYRIGTKAQKDAGLASIDIPIPASEAAAAQKTLQVLKNTFEGTIGNEPLVKSLDELLTKQSYTLSELDDIKALADNELNIFKNTGVLKESATAKGLNNVRDELKTLIENKATDNGFSEVKSLNKETQVAYEIENAMKKRLDVESKLPTLGLRDAILATGGFAASGPFAALGLVISKKVLESPEFRTFLANKLKSAPIEETTRLNEALQSRRYVEIIKYLAPVVNEFETATETSTGNGQ